MLGAVPSRNVERRRLLVKAVLFPIREGQKKSDLTHSLGCCLFGSFPDSLATTSCSLLAEFSPAILSDSAPGPPSCASENLERRSSFHTRTLVIALFGF